MSGSWIENFLLAYICENCLHSHQIDLIAQMGAPAGRESGCAVRGRATA
jgi:hypothetical protein